MSTGIYRTYITVSVLSEGEYVYRTLENVEYDITEGPCSGKVYIGVSKELNMSQLVAECNQHQTDPEFFLGDEYDQDSEDSEGDVSVVA